MSEAKDKFTQDLGMALWMAREAFRQAEAAGLNKEALLEARIEFYLLIAKELSFEHEENENQNEEFEPQRHRDAEGTVEQETTEGTEGDFEN